MFTTSECDVRVGVALDRELLGVGTEDLFLGLAGQQRLELLLLDRLALDEDLGDHLECVAVLGEDVLGALVRALDDPPDLIVDLPGDLGVQLVRKWLFESAAYRRFKASGPVGGATDFMLDAVVIPSPYAYSFGTFLSAVTTFWFALGGIITSVAEWLQRRGFIAKRSDDTLTPDMSTTSLVGGGLIAGDALAALGLGLVGLLATVAG